MQSKTLSVYIKRDPDTIYAFVSNLENLPKWASSFCKSIMKSADGWTIHTPQGPMGIRISEKNSLGVLDHIVSPVPGIEVFVPMRVVANGSGSEVLFTLFRRPEMSDDQHAQDVKWVEQDLSTLKRVMEKI
jgi:hypothetical protein